MPEDQQPRTPQRPLEPASWARRFAALVIDWILSTVVVFVIVGPHQYSTDRAVGLYVLGVFALECGFGWALTGASVGQAFTRIRVLRTDGRPVSLLPALLRAVLVCLVVPPLVFKPDGRGLHDLAVGSAAYHLP